PLLLIIGSLIPSYFTWGFSSYSVLPIYIPIIAIIAGTILAQLLITTTSIEKFNSYIIHAILLLTAGVILFLMRSNGLVYGDGFMVLDNYINYSGNIMTLSNNLMKPFDVLLYAFTYKLVSSIANFTPKTIISIISVAGGMVGLAAIWRLSNLLAEKKWDNLYYFLGMLSSGSTLLFFGHIENYTWATSCSLWMLIYTIKYCRQKSSIWKMITFGLLSFGFHILTLPGGAIILIALLYRFELLQKLKLTMGFIFLLLFVFVSTIAVVFHIFSLPQFFVPIWPLPEVPYWVLSPFHLIDVLNETILVAPLGLSFFLLIPFFKKNNIHKDNISYIIIGTMAAGLFASSFWLEPKLGAARDWDFLSFYGFPLTLFALYKLRHALSDNLSKGMLIIVSVVSIFCLLPNVMERMNLQRAVDHLDPVLWDSPQHALEYGHARRAMIWGTILQSEANRLDLAQRHFRRRIEAAPDSSSSAVAWFGIGDYFAEAKQYDSAIVYLRQAAVLKPENIGYIYRLGMILAEINQYQSAIAAAEYMAELESDNDRTLFGAGVIFLKCNQPEKARMVLKKAYALNPNNWDTPANIGVTYLQTHQPDSVIIWTRRALDLNHKMLLLYTNLINAYISLNQLDNARDVFNQYKMIEPNPDNIKRIEQILINP
ncbi:MAG: tetratricopeptide repeat protein, partial [bacterium]